MPEDASGGWRDERKHQGLDERMPFEDKVTDEEVSKILADGGPSEEVTQAPEHMENDAWAAYQISEELNDIYEEEGEYWVLEVSDGDLAPVFVVQGDEIVTHPPYDVDTTNCQWEIDGQKNNGHPFGLLSYTGENELFRNREFKTEELEVPVEGDQLDEVDQYDRLNNSYLAPGLTEDYRDAAEELIDRFYEE